MLAVLPLPPLPHTLHPQVAASHGFFFNLDALLLKLCGPFLDGSSSGVFWKRVDWKYVVLGERLDFKEVSVMNEGIKSEREGAQSERGLKE